MKKNKKKMIIGIIVAIVGIALVWGIWYIPIFIDNFGVEKLGYLYSMSPLEYSIKYKITDKNELKIFCEAASPASIFSSYGANGTLNDEIGRTTKSHEYEKMFSDLDKYDLSKYTIFAEVATDTDDTNSELKLDSITINDKLELNIREHITRFFNYFFKHPDRLFIFCYST